MGKRDVVLDEIRAFLAVYTIWGHVVAWNNLFTSDTALINFNVWVYPPLAAFFFLTGITNSLSRKRSLKEFYLTRISRLYKPYLIYALLCILLCFIVAGLQGSSYPKQILEIMQAKQLETGASSLHILSPGSPIYWFLPLDYSYIPVPEGLQILTFHLWFVMVYLLTVLFIPLLRLMQESRSRLKYLPFAALIVIMLILRGVKILYWGNGWLSPFLIGLPMSLSFALFWAYLGLFYSKLRHPSRPVKIGAAAVAFISAATVGVLLLLPKIFAHLGVELSPFWEKYFYFVFGFNRNTFPSNITFLLLNLAVFPLLYLGSPYLIRFIRRCRRLKLIDGLMSDYENSYLIIFLFSSFAFYLVNWSLKGLGIFDLIVKNELVGAVVLSLIMIPICGKLGKRLSPIENIRLTKRKKV
ncbi:MAG: acyltransferase family protein [Oscillospiraceae bacterium]|jgi:hypothetical protein|nr:acyltransferase family protein [Oscillospiraceae bacterium]